MQASRLRCALLAFAMVGLCATGCDVRPFRVQIPRFDTAQVQGLWVWRAAASGEFERFQQIEFRDLSQDEGGEYLRYSLDGSGVSFASPVVRDPASPEDVTLTLSFRRALGSFKLSSYNTVGESPLSDGTFVY
jgi:hypothetical protein